MTKKLTREDFEKLYVINENGCWIWIGRKHKKGYGLFGDNLLAHRLSWEFNVGPILNGLWVLHNCPNEDNKSCINPKHLWLGTHQDNYEDAVLKGQMASGNKHGFISHPEAIPKGEKNGQAKITEEQALEILSLYQSGIRQYILSKKYNLSRSAIHNLVHGVRWKHLHTKGE